jgi:hypothetical protein
MKNSRALPWMAAVGCTSLARQAGAEPLRIRGDAIAETRSPAGLVVLQGQDRKYPWVDAEAMVWAGARADPTADVLTLTLRLRAPRGIGELRVGRFVFSSGAIRPMAIDGASAIGRAPWGLSAEAFAGLPVVPRLATTGHDQVAGGRLAQMVGSKATAGVSYVEQRLRGRMADQEVGADLAAVPIAAFDVAARGAYDLISQGVADALVSAATRAGAYRFELFATHRSPSRLLPATSLFSVLGDMPSQTLGGTVRWDAAPRLDLLLSGGGQDIGGKLGGYGSLRGTLRLDDRGAGSVGVEVKRQDVAGARWMGVRTILTQPLFSHLRFSSELEIATGETATGYATWPWGLLALGWRWGPWEAATALEAGSSPRYKFEVNGLFRVARAFEFP